jgi:hypothetical protein
MTSDKDLKRVVRARMEKTGESYTAARAQILSKPPRKRSSAPARPAPPRLTSIPAPPLPPPPAARPAYAKVAGMADARIADNTGHTWEEWVHLLDGDSAAEMAHPDIARLVSDKYRVRPWWTQAVTVGYERIKGLRARGQRRDGTYEASKSRTFDVPVATLFDAWADAATRRRWLDAKDVKVRTASRPRSIRLGWSDGTVIALWFTAKGKKSTVAVQHTRLRDRETADAFKKFWAEQLDALARVLER